MKCFSRAKSMVVPYGSVDNLKVTVSVQPPEIRSSRTLGAALVIVAFRLQSRWLCSGPALWPANLVSLVSDQNTA
ncbi:hypothetical protein CI1B_00510 [Bradyrhizobium ivorense]|uniref:Uncharacterized protein n=1 Tax=Bradyrhizobium ivorense TaxID=2511166 RepID=A0A508SUI1_9BRAD|nr:hypothetical protein CI1B_00510 [Bradyrhizobium ivorense]VIO79247.1 hypothetical protein CI41S_68150 [Bradyrhizobium ivorense]